MTNKPPESDSSHVALFDGVVHVRWAPGSVVSESNARAMMAKAAELCPGQGYPLLVDMAGMKWIDHAAREVLAAYAVPRVAIVGASPVDEMVVHFYLARHSPSCPTRYFTCFQQAMTWLAAADGTVDTAGTQPEAAPNDHQPPDRKGDSGRPGTRC